MTEELEQLIKKMKEAAPKKELEGGGIDEQKVSQIINEKIFDLVNNPKTALQIMATILKDPKNPNYPKWEELKKNLILLNLKIIVILILFLHSFYFHNMKQNMILLLMYHY